MRLDLSIDLAEPRTLRECADQLSQLRAAATILTHQAANRPDSDTCCEPLFERINVVEVQAAEMPVTTAADAAAGLDILESMIDDWNYADGRDARLFQAIRSGLGNLSQGKGGMAPPYVVRTADKIDEAIMSIALLASLLEAQARGKEGDADADNGAAKLALDQLAKLRDARALLPA